MKSTNSEKFLVIKDSREQLGWNFEENDYCAGTVTGTLKTGDYSISGFENTFVIERKGTITEFAQNINQKRFDAELVRLEQFKHAFIFLEFTSKDIDNWPYSSGLPKNKLKNIRVSKLYILRKINEYNLNYQTKIQLVGAYGKGWAISLMKRFWETYK